MSLSSKTDMVNKYNNNITDGSERRKIFSIGSIVDWTGGGDLAAP